MYTTFDADILVWYLSIGTLRPSTSMRQSAIAKT